MLGADTLGIPAVAARLGCSRELVYKLCREKKLRHYKVGRLVRIPPEAVGEYLATCEVAAAGVKAPAVRRVNGVEVPDYEGVKRYVDGLLKSKP